MRHTGRLSRLLSITLALAFIGAVAQAEVPDWTDFRGPTRDGKSSETGLLKSWPEGGPKLLWKLEGLGSGYSSISIADGRIFTMGDREGDDEKSQFVIAYDLGVTGVPPCSKALWYRVLR